MVALRIEDMKVFTKKLFIGETFDRFLVREASIVTFNSFTIDGRVRQGYYSEEELEAGKIENYSSWKTLRPFCFSLIKGSKLPESFAIVFKLPPDNTEKFLKDRNSSWLPEQVGGLFINIRYEDQVLYCVTGLSMNQFTMDRSLEREWDDSVKAFLRKDEIVFEEG